MVWIITIIIAFGSASTGYSIAPGVLMKGAEEVVGANGRLSSIYMDSWDQPHLVCDGTSMAYFYDKIGGTWRSSALDVGLYGFGQYYNPHLEIDPLDRAWCSGILVSGLGVILREDMKSNPSRPYFSNQRVNGAWDSGNLSLDPSLPNEAVLMSAYGYWKKVVYSASSSSRVVPGASGRMYAGQDGEKKGFWISKKGGANGKGSVLHADGTTHGVWHLAICGYGNTWPNQYQNSVRSAQGLSQVTWARYSGYTYSMGDDGVYPDCVADNKEPERAYMVADFSVGGRYNNTCGIAMNIWTGSAMKFSTYYLLVIDRYGTSGMRRYAPQLAPAKDGGAFVTWTRGGRVKVMYISPEGIKGSEWDVAAGRWSDICADSKGNLHIVYNNGSIRYQKWIMSGAVSAATLPGDFDGDGADDLAVFDPLSTQWYIQSAATTNTIVWARPFGAVNGIPVVGDFNADTISDIGVFDSMSNQWMIQSLVTTSTILNIQFGVSNTIPLVGDFNGDGYDDIGAWNPADGQWHLTNVLGTAYSLTGYVYGISNMIPLPRDYTGDGKCDLGLYDPNTAKWYVRSITNLNITTHFVTGKVVGVWGAIPVPADYDGDGKADLAVVDPATFFWYSQSATNSNGKSAVRQWGFSGGRPVVGDFNKDGYTDMGVWNPSDGRWYIRASNPGPARATAVSWGFKGGAVSLNNDFNNNGTNDFTVYANGKWYIRDTKILAHNRSWGFTGALPVPGDYNGDGRADLGVYDNAVGKWYIQGMASNVLAWDYAWGYTGTHGLAADFNGDGAKDLTVYDPAGRWYITTLAGQTLAWNTGWGFTGASPVPADYDGDSKADLAVYANGRWYIRSLEGVVLKWNHAWGFAGAVPVVGDFDGDSKADLAICANQTWYIQAMDGRVLAWNRPWGVSGGLPVAGDTDGDGADEIAVYDSATGWWYVQSLSDVTTTIVWGRTWGAPGMTPLGSPAAN